MHANDKRRDQTWRTARVDAQIDWFEIALRRHVVWSSCPSREMAARAVGALGMEAGDELLAVQLPTLSTHTARMAIRGTRCSDGD